MNESDFSLSDMTIHEKLNLMERIWVDLSEKPDQVPTPDWHGDILQDRAQSVRDGKSKFESWEQVKEQLKSRYR